MVVTLSQALWTNPKETAFRKVPFCIGQAFRYCKQTSGCRGQKDWPAVDAEGEAWLSDTDGVVWLSEIKIECCILWKSLLLTF